MKNLFLVRLFVMGAMVVLGTPSFSQLSGADIARAFKHSSAGKPPVNASADSDKMALASIKSVNEKMFTHFNRNFSNAKNIVVSTEGSETRISYQLNGVASSTRYNAKGKWLLTISHYDESLLASDLRSSIESSYPGFLVAGTAVEISIGDKKATFVMIENKKEWKRIRVVDGEMDIYEAYRKQ